MRMVTTSPTMLPAIMSMVPAALITTMNDRALYRLMSWLSPSYPVGAFSYSHGLEWLVETGDIRDAKTLTAWIASVLLYGGGRNDAIFFALAHRAAAEKRTEDLTEITALAGAAAASQERALETLSQGRAFAETTSRTWRSPTVERFLADPELPLAYPVAVAIAAADHAIELPPALAAYVQAFAANLVSAGVRLVPLGHTAGQVVITELEGPVTQTVAAGLAGTADDIGGSAFLMDIAAMKHETQYTRLFRS